MATKTKSDEVSENKNKFKDLISKLNDISGKVDEAEIALEKVADKSKSAPVKQPIMEDGAHSHKEMRDILSRFNNMFEENIKPVLMEDTVTSEYDLAVKTKITQSGVQIGQWEIKKLTEGKEIIYSIDNIETKITILEDIRTYVTASAVVKLLNAGKAANSSEVSAFLRLDESFRINYQDALIYKRKFLKTHNPVYEDRFESCKGKALQLKEAIKNKSNNLEIL